MATAVRGRVVKAARGERTFVKKLLVILTDPLSVYLKKGEIKRRYYNPGNLFSEVHFVSPASHDVAPSDVQSLVGDAHLVVHPLGASYYWTALLPFGRLASVIRRINPDVVRAYDPGVRGTLAVLWAHRLGIPSVVSIHIDPDEQRRVERRPIHQLRRLFERYALPRADAIICVTRYVEAYARRYATKDVSVIYNRVYSDEFISPSRQHPVQQDRSRQVTILSVGRLVPQKYQECLIRAVRELGLDARLVLIGDGELREPLERLVSELGMDGQVTFCRAVPHAEIARQYAEADIFAIATHHEGFCIPVLEAMAAGLPVVASRIGPIEEIVGDAGFLVDNYPAAFAAALDPLVKDASLRHAMGMRAAERARTMDGHIMEERERALYAGLFV